MCLDKSIKHGKERRKAYRGAKLLDRSCRNHGLCPWCRRQRLFNGAKAEEHSRRDLKTWEED